MFSCFYCPLSFTWRTGNNKQDIGSLKVFYSSSTGSVASDKGIMLEPDRPFLRVKIFERAELECCYKNAVNNGIWVKRLSSGQTEPVNLSEEVFQNYSKSNGKQCGFLTLENVKLNDTGMYQCHFINTTVYTHGTYLQVFSEYVGVGRWSEGAQCRTSQSAMPLCVYACVWVESSEH